MCKILVINPGSTSTKLAVFNKETLLHSETLHHSVEDPKSSSDILEQYIFRKEKTSEWLEAIGISISSLAAIVARGGLLQPIPSGVYAVNKQMLSDLQSARFGKHASNLAALIAHELGSEGDIPCFVVDPVVVDEMEAVARISGCPAIERKSIFHALNQKAIARQAAKLLNGVYEEKNLIVVHMGGGISIGAHRMGRVIDVNNALDGEGPFSPERAGTLPVTKLIDYCFAEGKSRESLVKEFVGRSGLVGHLQTNDAREVEGRIEQGDEKAKLYYETMAMQIAKEVGRAAAVLKGKVDGIVLTGGLAFSTILTSLIKERVQFIGTVLVIPGENEMEALALGALRVLTGDESCKEYPSGEVTNLPKGRVIIDVARCKGCELCVQVCPQAVLAMSKEINNKGFHPVSAVALDKCTGCTLCATICPDVVLKIERE